MELFFTIVLAIILAPIIALVASVVFAKILTVTYSITAGLLSVAKDKINWKKIGHIIKILWNYREELFVIIVLAIIFGPIIITEEDGWLTGIVLLLCYLIVFGIIYGIRRFKKDKHY